MFVALRVGVFSMCKYISFCLQIVDEGDFSPMMYTYLGVVEKAAPGVQSRVAHPYHLHVRSGRFDRGSGKIWLLTFDWW